MNLLTIDDNIDTTEAVNDYCNMEGISCKVVNDGQKGLSEIHERDYDLILLDLAMPEYSGFDLLSEMKKQGVRDKKIVVFSACCCLKMDDFKDYKEVGVREIIKKPVELDHLDKVVKSILMNGT